DHGVARYAGKGRGARPAGPPPPGPLAPARRLPRQRGAAVHRGRLTFCRPPSRTSANAATGTGSCLFPRRVSFCAGPACSSRPAFGVGGDGAADQEQRDEIPDEDAQHEREVATVQAQGEGRQVLPRRRTGEGGELEAIRTETHDGGYRGDDDQDEQVL